MVNSNYPAFDISKKIPEINAKTTGVLSKIIVSRSSFICADWRRISMTESTARAERFDLQAAPSPLYIWEVPQKPVSVRIPFSLIDRLEREAVESFRSLTSRGSEIGGLLVGAVTPGSPLIVSIEDYDLITCDYSRGPLYRLSDADMGRFEQAIQQRQAAGRGVAGFFRSHTRKGIALDADDLTFFQARFREPHHLALLVRPFATKASTAGIFIWENGKVNGEASCQEFPFRSSELGAGQSAEQADSKAAATSVPAPLAPKSAARAQIVPIASRREISLPPVPHAEPAPHAAPAAPPPAPAATAAPAATVAPVAAAPAAAPAAIVTPPAPVVEEKTAIVPAKIEKPAKSEKVEKLEKTEKAEKLEKIEKTERNDKTEKIAKIEKAVKAETPAPKVSLPPAKTEKAEPLPAFAEPAITAPETGGGKGLKLILAAVASIALFVVLFVYPGLMRTSSKPPAPAHQDSSQLQLRVERAAGELLLSWNRDADAIRNASKAVLEITDGEQHENVQMDLAQLANGSIVYSPSGTDISFKMEVVDKSQKTTASESVRMLRTRPSPLQEQTDAAAKAAAAAGANKPAAGATPSTTIPDPNDPAVTEPAKPAPTPLKTFRTESLSQRLRPAASSDLPDAPTVSAGDRSAPSSIPGVSVSTAAPAPFVPAPPPPAAAATPAASSPTEAKPKSGGQIQQAVLIYRKDAEYPKIAKQTGAKGTVTLTATIGKDGTIKAVKVVSGHPMLVAAASEAVKQWRYRPTLLNGQPVETETQVLVNFMGDK
jgi:TonB family protein